ncbi:MAG: radical SAM domain-containing protein [Thermoleophilia bacterium]
MEPERVAALQRRWDELPAAVRTPNQMLGRRIAGCEGTHGVFPRCDLACSPCYHSRDANRVPVDGAHTVAEVRAQMALLRELRGPGQPAQLIGGEVTLLAPDDHAAALQAMIDAGRKPMSMTHGDFEYEYLEALALDPTSGRPRFRHLSFAAHIDSTMRGRRGAERPADEEELDPVRRRFCAMFARLRAEHGVTSFLAHNMTVTPGNLDQVAGVVRRNRDVGFRMFSFQPAAYVGNPARWADGYRAVDPEEVWRRVQDGVGARLHHRAMQYGDPRCNRTAYGGFAGDRYWPLLDEDDPRDARALTAFLDAYGGMDFGAPAPLVALRLARGALARPAVVPAVAGAAARALRRVGGVAHLIRARPRPVTFVMHSFMDASVVRPAWEAIEAGAESDDPQVRAAQERLQACSYAMAHPEDGRLVPACAQHAVLDPAENRRLVSQLRRGGGASAR